MSDLYQKLAISKAIMDKTEGIKRGSAQQPLSQPVLENYDIPNAKYNIPSEFMSEGTQQSRVNTKPVGTTSIEAIKSSKLPDEIKRLMIEHPIEQPQQQSTTISDEIVEKATRLMKNQSSNNYEPESAKGKTQKTENFDLSKLNQMVKNAVNEALRENGLLIESTEKSNDTFSFKVGKHIFEGKVTKIKKIA